MMKRLFLLVFCLVFFACIGYLVPVALVAQNTEKQQEQELVYSKEWRTGVKLHTNGYGLSLDRAKVLNRSRKNLWHFELQEIRHPKQFRKLSIIPDGSGNPHSYFYGKQNNFYNLNVSYGQHRILAEKGRKSGVEVTFNYSGGLSLGLLKPYYLRLYYRNDELEFRDERYSEENREKFLDEDIIYGASGILFGLKELSVIPGIVAHAGFTFDWANYGESIKAVEVGVMANLYYKRIPIMVDADNNFLFTNLYARLVFGRRSSL